MNEQAIMDILDRLRTRFFGKYRGVVTDIDAGTLRIKASVPSVLPNGATGWCSPCVPYAGDQVGMIFLPEVGAGVWIEFEGGDPSYPIWSGCYWFDGKWPADATPSVKVIVTSADQKILFDTNNNQIVLTDSHENRIVMNSEGISIQRGSTTVVINDGSFKINDSALEVT